MGVGGEVRVGVGFVEGKDGFDGALEVEGGGGGCQGTSEGTGFWLCNQVTR